MMSVDNHPEHEVTLLHRLVADHGGHSVTIVRDGKRLLGWSNGRTGSGIALADLIALVYGATATHVGWQHRRKGYTTVDYEHKRAGMGDTSLTDGDRAAGFTEARIYTLK
jgi:hypothetical protein